VLGEILGRNGDAIELVFDDGLDFGQGVEPGQDGFSFLLAVFKTLIELFLDVVRETGDFAVHMLVQQVES